MISNLSNKMTHSVAKMSRLLPCIERKRKVVVLMVFAAHSQRTVGGAHGAGKGAASRVGEAISVARGEFFTIPKTEVEGALEQRNSGGPATLMPAVLDNLYYLLQIKLLHVRRVLSLSSFPACAYYSTHDLSLTVG